MKKNHLNLLEHILGFLQAKGKNYGWRDKVQWLRASVACSLCRGTKFGFQTHIGQPINTWNSSSKKFLGVVLHARVTALPEAKPGGLLQVWG